MKMLCKCGQGSTWRVQGPVSQHRYRVECSFCHKFAKWGTEGELQAQTAAGSPVVVEPYVEPKAGPTLDAFFVDD